MRRGSLFTGVSLILVLTLLGFAIFTLLQPFSRIRNQISFRFSDTNLYLDINADAEWSNDENNHFEANTEDGELDVDLWSVPDIIFSTDDDNQLIEAEIRITVINRNPEKEVKVSISNVAFDSDPIYADNPRFITCVETQNSVSGQDGSFPVTTSDQLIEPINIPASPNTEEPSFMIITFRYQLIRQNIDFDFSQNISITFETV
ncbi:MAG: hypothetical protein PHR96_03655 [Clostridia bacterium]|nr:hypothetical protein [Clostridia bacterium]